MTQEKEFRSRFMRKQHLQKSFPMIQENQSLYVETVQRLKDRASRDQEFARYSNSLPIALSNLISFDELILEARKQLLESNQYKGNTKLLCQYKSRFNPLTSIQKSWCCGLLLGDATGQANNNSTQLRLKMQQSIDHVCYLEATCALLYPFILSGVSKPVQRHNSTMLGINTIQHHSFMPLVDIFQNPSVRLSGNSCIRKKS